MRPEARLSRRGALVALAGLALSACATVVQPPSEVPADFVFVRDDAGLLPDAEVRQTEEILRSIAERTGVYGVVVTAREIANPPRVAGPIIEEIARSGGEALIGFCTPQACDLTSPAAYSDSMADDLGLVARVPEGVPGQGVAQGSRGLPAWIELVGAVSTLEE